MERKKRSDIGDIDSRGKKARVDEEESELVQKEEEKFVLEQHKLRAGIRIKDQRWKTIDLLVAIAYWESGKYKDCFIDLTENVDELLERLSLSELEGLIKEVEVFVRLETQSNIRHFWKTVLSICSSIVRSLNAQSGGIHKNVQKEIVEMLSKKTVAQLEELEAQVESRLKTDKSIDVEYWESVLKQIETRKLKLALQEFQEAASSLFVKKSESEMKEAVEEGPRRPTLHAGRIAQLEAKLLRSTIKRRPPTTEELYLLESKQILEDTENVLNEEYPLESKHKWVNPKIVPEKPKYVNRVQNGFDWNPYNRTHYDSENLPPKMAKGYKFNVFYPALLNPQETPTYYKEKIPSDPDHIVVRFSAGAPYRDVCFKIDHKEWEYSRKKGFRCEFENGVLRLWFQFKTYKYRK